MASTACIILLMSTLVVVRVSGTVDMSVAEFQYLVDHLAEDECRRLATALHFHSFELPKKLDEAEGKIPLDVGCLELLLHWNSRAGEGRGETHNEVVERLHQIGRSDLAEWLSKAVFHDLSQDLLDLLTDETTEKKVTGYPATAPSTSTVDTRAEKGRQGVLTALLCVSLGSALLFLICSVVCLKSFCEFCFRCWRNVSNEESNEYRRSTASKRQHSFEP